MRAKKVGRKVENRRVSHTSTGDGEYALIRISDGKIIGKARKVDLGYEASVGDNNSQRK